MQSLTAHLDRTSLRRSVDWHRPLMYLAGALAGTGALSAVAYPLDGRTLAGVPIWSKPLQFSISFAAYAVTLAWLVSRLRSPRRHRLAHRTGTVIAAATGLEMLAVVVQVLRGQQSHFNYSSPFNAAVFAGMGIAAMVIFVATAVVGVLVLRDGPGGDRATTRAVRLGLAVSLLGMSVGALMAVPRSYQQGSSVRGAHSVGVRDGGPSLPLTGWSTTGGDLRVPHFIGLHALQALPLLALVLTLVPALGQLTERARARLVGVGAAGYAGLFATSLWQALRGQPVTAPDAWTWTALVGLLGAVAGAAALVVRADRRSVVGYALAAAASRSSSSTVSTAAVGSVRERR